MKQEKPKARRIEPNINLPEGYLEHNNTRLAFDPVKHQWVWPGGKRISCPAEAAANVAYLDKLVNGDLPCVYNKSGYVRDLDVYPQNIGF